MEKTTDESRFSARSISKPNGINTKWVIIQSCLGVPRRLYGRTFGEYLERLELIPRRLKEIGFKIKRSKCRFFQKKIQFPIYIVPNNGVVIDPEKINAVKNMNDPHKIKQLRVVLGLIRFYHIFIEGF